MNLQFADLNADGHDDMITATFEGTAMVVYGSEEGWRAPEHLKDSQDRNIVLSVYYDMDEEAYKNTDRSPEGESNAEDHCVSTTVMDWDNDGDLDLLLGAKEGRLYMQENVGSADNPVFRGENHLLKTEGGDFMIPGGLTAAQPFDWDNDGDLDLVCGSFKGGGVYLVENTGMQEGVVTLAKPVLLLDGQVDVGEEDLWTSGDWYVTPVDYDNDGKLDLLVGMQIRKPEEKKELTEEEKKELAAYKERLAELQTKSSERYEKFMEENKDLYEDEMKATEAYYASVERDEEAKKLQDELYEIWGKVYELEPPVAWPEAGVYLLRGK